MRRTFLFLFFLLCISAGIIAQNTNIGLQYIDHATGITNNYNTSNINSDFGPRVCPDCSKWHMGIDLNRSGITDHGDRIITPVTGTIAQIYRYGSYIVLVINGPDNQDYGYGHIFEDYSDIALPIVLGNFVLKKMNPPNATVLAIIDITNNRAFSTVPNGTVSYGTYPTFTTINTVQTGWPVAPVGNSAATNGTHLHLYSYRNPALNAQGIDNCKNPLQLLSHQNTDFDISIRSINNLTEYGKNTYYAGNQLASIKIVDSVQTSSGPPLNNAAYSNAIMDIDSVLVQIKKYGEPDIKYQNLKGSHYQSKIVLGGRFDHSRYPNNIDEIEGDPTHVGVEPHAYNPNDHAKDYYFFSDFYTRIKNTDQFGGALELANNNSEARYSDGVYLIKPRAFRINNAEATNPANPNNNEAKQIIIDNFRPYISRVKIYEGPGSNWILRYNRGWQWVNNVLYFEPQPESAIFSQTQDIKVEITTSEPMSEVTLKVGNILAPTQNCGTDLNKTKWEFILPVANTGAGEKQIAIYGFDLANNPIQDKPNIIPIRQSNTLWTPTPTCGQGPVYNADLFHKFIYGINPVDFTAMQLGTDYKLIEFTDNSPGYVFQNIWKFGDNTLDGSGSTINHQYSANGVFSVTHSIISNGTTYSLTKPVSVNELTLPKVNKTSFSFVKDNGKSANPHVIVDFFSDCEGIIGSYSWQINGLNYTDPNPKGIKLQEKTTYNVALTVWNAAGSDTYNMQVYINPDLYPFATILDWEVTYYVHDLEVSTANFNDSEPIEFTIAFGDGITETYTEDYGTYHTFTHNYYELGEYIVFVTVKQGSHTEVHTAKRVRVQPRELDVIISYTSPSTPPHPTEQIVCNATVSGAAAGSTFYGNWSIYRVGSPNSYYAENFPIQATQIPEFKYTPDKAGRYIVMLYVNVSGFAASGYAVEEIEVLNAPKYVEANISSGSYLLSLYSEYTLYGSVWPTGDPGVAPKDWNPTNIRWILTGPRGKVMNIEFPYDQYMFTRLFKYKFEEAGTYYLQLETWNKNHQYEENGKIDTINNSALSFYAFVSKRIEVKAEIPSIKINSPTNTYVEVFANDTTIKITISNPSLTPINWLVEQSPGCGIHEWLQIQTSSGTGLCCGNQQSFFVYIDTNANEDNRFGCIDIKGFSNGIQVQGSPATLHIDQYGKRGPFKYMAKGSSPDKNFGFAVAVDGETAAIGSPHTAWNIGQAYIYRKISDGTWVKLSTLKSSDNNPDFGRYIDISGDNACVLGSDKVYFFKRGNPDWGGVVSELKYNITSQTPKSVALWGDYAVVGFPSFSNYRGKATIFCRNQGGVDNWGIVKELIGDGESDFFGNSVDLYNDQLVVGAPQGGDRQGYLKIFDRNLVSGNDWGTEQKIFAPDFGTYESGTSEYGKGVSIFENKVSTTYYRYLAQAPGMFYGPSLFSISYIGDINGNWEELGRDFVQDRPAGNNVVSATMFKTNYLLETEKYFRSGFGIPFEEYVLTNGSDGSFGSVLTTIGSSPGQYYNCYFENLKNRVSYTPNQVEQYGNSVSFSYMGDVIGVPGYDNEAGMNVGMAMFDHNQILGNNLCEAGIDLSFVNFTKPTGNYSDVIAHSITLGGRALPAIIENGANIKYEANELLLQDGFLADHGSDFTALALDCGSGNSDMLVKKGNPNINFNEWPLSDESRKFLIKAYMQAFPDLPWQTFNLAEDADFVKVEDFIATLKPDNTNCNNTGIPNKYLNQVMPDFPVLLINDSEIMLKIGNSITTK